MMNDTNQTLRSLVAALAALIMAGTFLAAAAGPAVANEVNIASESNIVRGN
jgi:hypothetical protein